jgi:hypothetical protein
MTQRIEDLLGDEIERMCKAAYEPELPEQGIGRSASYQAPPHENWKQPRSSLRLPRQTSTDMIGPAKPKLAKRGQTPN